MLASDGFEAFYMQHYQSLFKMVYRYISSPQDCENIVQDVFLEMLENFASIPESQRVIWAYNKTRNKRRSFVRSQQRSQRRVEQLWRTRKKYQSPDDFERRELIQKSLLQMPPDKADLLELSHLTTLSQQEIAQILGVSSGSVSKLLQRAEQYFYRSFKALQDGEPGEY